jgi:DNA-directed RNA polymerase specialized sigma24 family protein
MTTTLTATNPADAYAEIEALYPEIQRKAGFLAAKYNEDADDLAQEMTLRLLEKAAQLEGQKPAYILQQAEWGAMMTARANRAADSHYVKAETVTIDDAEMGTDEVDIIDLIPEQGTVEGQIIKRERLQRLVKVCKVNLSESNYRLVRLLALGHKKGEAAKMLGLQRSDVTRRLDTIGKALYPATVQ